MLGSRPSRDKFRPALHLTLGEERTAQPGMAVPQKTKDVTPYTSVAIERVGIMSLTNHNGNAIMQYKCYFFFLFFVARLDLD
jgi:hypothetical protein